MFSARDSNACDRDAYAYAAQYNDSRQGKSLPSGNGGRQVISRIYCAPTLLLFAAQRLKDARAKKEKRGSSVVAATDEPACVRREKCPLEKGATGVGGGEGARGER